MRGGITRPGELFPRVGFIITTLTGTNRAVVHCYNGREPAPDRGPRETDPVHHELSVRGEWTAMAELITDEMIEVYAVTGMWSDIGARGRFVRSSCPEDSKRASG